MEFDHLIGLIIILCIVTFIIIDRKNIEVKGLIFLRKSKRLNRIIEEYSLKYSKIFNFLGILSILSVFISFSIFIYFSFYQFFQPPKTTPVQIVLPSLPGVCQADFILCVPAYFWLLVIPIIAISHELMHAFLARSNGLKIKSIGYAFLLFLPAFFVEIDEKKLKRCDIRTKLKIYSSGSFGNFIVAILSILFLFIFTSIINSNFHGIIVEAINNTPAYYANLSGIIIKINDKEIRDLNDLFEISKTFKPNQTIRIETTEKILNITLDENAKIGIKIIGNAYYPKNEFSKKYKDVLLLVLLFFKNLFFWLFLLSFGIGMFNLLPIKPLDGGLFFSELLENKFGKTGKKLYNLLSIFTIFLIFLLVMKYILKI